MWDEIARDSLAAARVLADAGHHRSSVSRSYYAALQALTWQLPKDKVPKHKDVETLVERHIVFLPIWKQQRLVSQLKQLRRTRIEADYVRTAAVDAEKSAEMLKIVGSVFKNLEVSDA